MRALVVLAALALALTQAAAQSVRGAVRDSALHAPIAGAVVTALARDGRSLARALTNEQGRFAIPSPAGGAQLRVVSIGYRPATISIATLAAETEPVIELSALPTLLEPVSTGEDRRCPVRADRERALGLWQQARTALLASVVTSEMTSPTVEILKYQRTYVNDRRVLVDQQVQRSVVTTSRPFVPARTPGEFARDGYMINFGDQREFDAPDAQVLIDDSFTATHCFAIAGADAGHSDALGLAFEPAPDRESLVDVRGVLWIGRQPARLESLDFAYTGLPNGQAARASGGSMTFQTLANGAVFVDRWEIRGPGSTVTSNAARSPASQHNLIKMAGRELRSTSTGGQVVSAEWNDGTRWAAKLARVAGRVVPNIARKQEPLRVWLLGTPDTTDADSTGAFAFASVLPGSYRVGAGNWTLAAAGISQLVGPDSAEAADIAQPPVELRMALQEATFRSLCHLSSRSALPSRILMVRVVNTDGWAVGRDSVYAMWPEPETHLLGIAIRHSGDFADTTSRDGRIPICDPPRNRPIRIRIGRSAEPDTSVVVQLPAEVPIGLLTIVDHALTRPLKPEGHSR